MAARLKVDENLPSEIADLLISHGYEAATVLDQGWRGMPDHDLWQGVQAEERWLVTADKGFGDLRLYPPGAHAGVILLRSAGEGLDDYLQLAELVLDRVALDDVAGAVIVVTHRAVRIRRAPA